MEVDILSDNWYKVDNVAKAFLASYNDRDTRSFRISCALKEEIDKEILQQALDLAITDMPQFQVVIHKGLFWHYLEETSKKPVVKQEHNRPCPTLYGEGMNSKLHYTVTYYKNRINLDMFHALADGNGGLEFLNVIVQYYLQIKYPGKLEDISLRSGAAAEEMIIDSFKHYFDKNTNKKSFILDAVKDEQKVKKTYQIRGRKLPNDELQFFEVHMSAKKMLALAKECNVSLTSYLGARLMLAIYKGMPALQKTNPITISMPVNLRNYYPSETIRNFFNSVYVTHTFSGEETLEELAVIFDKKFKEQLTPEKIAIKMHNYEKLEQFFFVRMVPLFIKNPVVNFFTKRENKSVTAIISNMGKLKVPTPIDTYIDGYAAFCSSEKMFITITTYEDDLTFGIASPYKNTGILKRFFKGIADNDIEIKLFATNLNDYKTGRSN